MRKLYLLITLSSLICLVNAQTDTTGMSTWKPLHNSTLSWEYGAFNANSIESQLDYGWGKYNTINHEVIGDSIYIIKLASGEVKQLFIDKKISIENKYLIEYADLDETELTKETLDIGSYTSKLFVYYSIQDGVVIDREPAQTAWDFVLTKYSDPVFGYYTVTGFLLNEGTSASYLLAADSASAYDAALADTTTFTDSIAVIGNSWYDYEGYSIVPNKKRVYFVKQADGDIYRLNTTYFESGISGEGRVGVRYKKLYPTEEAVVEDTLAMGSGYANDVFYELNAGTKNTAARNNWDIALKTNIMTASIFTNSTMGVELYTYPKADASAWVSVGVSELSVKDISIWPNPAIDQVNIRSSEFRPKDFINVSIFDLTGRKVKSVNNRYSSGLSVDIEDLKKGMYLLRIDNNEKQGVLRFIVN